MATSVEKANGPQIGGKIRRIRRTQRMSQKDLAASLGISTSYLNLIEHNRRSVTGPLLFKLCVRFGLELSDLQDNDEARLAGDLMEVFGDELFGDVDMTNLEVRDLAFTNPAAAKAIIHLYDRYRSVANRQAGRPTTSDEASGADGNAPPAEGASATEPVSDLLQAHGNHFPALEAAAERIAADLDVTSQTREQAMGAFLANAFGVHLRIGPIGGQRSRLYDPERMLLEVADTLPPESRDFQIAQQMGLLVAGREIDAILDQAPLANAGSASLGRSALAAYFAGAVLMPYERFHRAAVDTRYDIQLLQRRFSASFEQVCHRLTTLQRPGMQGVPLHFVRTDIAGNISKRFSLSGIHIPRHTGACPRWNVYTAFLQPDRLNIQISQMPDGRMFFCIARTVTKGEDSYNAPRQHYSVGIGCDMVYAKSFVYSDGIDLKNPRLVVPTGINCRVCPRTDCAQRAAAPTSRYLDLDPNQRGISAYSVP